MSEPNKKTRIKSGPKILLALLVIGGGVFGAKYYVDSHGSTKMASTVPVKSGDLEDFKDTTGNTNQTNPNVQASLPGNAVAKPAAGVEQMKLLEMAWNAQMGLNLANGGPITTEGSLMSQRGVSLKIERQDDYSKMQEELVACANQLSKGGKTCHNGANFAIIMGDGGPAFLAGLNETLSKLGPDFKAEIIGSVGRSAGEDAFMAPPDVQGNPEKARGLLIAGVIKDGDWNIAEFFASQNGICNNPDFTTYDPNCLNWVSTKDFVEAGEKFIQGACEDRKVVAGGKRTGKTQNVCVNSVVTWTPGDVSVAQKKGGLVKILSTKENSSQMPATIIGIKHFDSAHHDEIVGMLRAAFEGGDLIKTGGQQALKRAADISAVIYKEETGAYWAKYYRGVQEEDKQGNLVDLGGSRVFNLADNLRYFGLESGSTNAFAATYNLFGGIAHQQYPVDLPTFPSVEEVLNTSFVQEIAASGESQGKVDAPQFANAPSTTEVVAKKSYHINFDTGKATIRSDSEKQLQDLLAALTVGDNTFVDIEGHTDNTGSPEANQTLSEQRAQAVKQFLEQRAPKVFPRNRLSATGFGQTRPLVPNTNPANLAKNRRVDVILKVNQ